MAKLGGSFAQRERSALCDLLADLGPDAATLCEGWRSADLAAHLFIRDHRPDAQPGMSLTFAPLQAWTKRVQDGARDTLTWDALISKVRAGPAPLLRPFDKALNTLEYFVHHEDLRRAQTGWEPRLLAPEDETALWSNTGYLRTKALVSSRVLHRPPSAGRLVAPGRPPLLLTKTGEGTVIQGPVGELVMWLNGRKQAARVEITTDAGL
jgi:uncharacterized protein (TIGR03085 family)